MSATTLTVVPGAVRRAFYVMVSTALLVIGAVVAAPTANAASPDLRGQADSIMNMDYLRFVRHKQDVHPAPFNWHSDGCSGPKLVKPVYRSLFLRPCQLHDFGYRNYGRHAGGLQLGPDEKTRAWIDARFASEMNRLCDRNFSGWRDTYNKILCKGEAANVYAAVRNKAKSAYYA